jgi:hypothetical protein
MSILQDISKRLLAVANLYPEERNKALMEVLIYIEEVQYDMVLEQKNLIMSVIEDLIAENDAEQISKSKLVFVEEVEEQIAPTIKTRKKKVVVPVVESTSEDLPDFIGLKILIKNLPEPVKKLVLFRQKQQNLPFNEDVTLLDDRSFRWVITPEDSAFWEKIEDEGDLREFKEKYGSKGEKVDEVISDDLPDFITAVSTIRNMPEPILKLIRFRRKQLGIKTALNLDGLISGAFNWDKVSEGYAFWDKLSNLGDLREFKEKYGNKGEKVDEVIEFEELNEFVQTLTPTPVASTPTPATTPSATTQMVKYVEVIVYPPSGGVLNIKVFSVGETMGVLDYLWERLQMKELSFNFSAITDYSTYTTQIKVKTSESGAEIFENLIAKFDDFVKPELDWEMFGNRKSDFDLIALNTEILKDAFTPKVVAPTPAPVLPSKPFKVVTPKSVVVEKPKPVVVEKPKQIVREKPRPVPVEKPKPVKVVAPKVEKVVKQKLTKPKVEDDLSFLNDLDNIF